MTTTQLVDAQGTSAGGQAGVVDKADETPAT